MSWLAEDRAGLAAGRILDAAAGLFAERGVAAVGMGEVARAAGCSRATLYRYFPDRTALRQAFVSREAARVGEAVAAEATTLEDAVLLAVRLVREAPALAAWFTGEAAGLGLEAALGLDPADDDARWLVRCIVSLLAMPGRDAEDEQVIVRDYVVGALGALRTVEE